MRKRTLLSLGVITAVLLAPTTFTASAHRLRASSSLIRIRWDLMQISEGAGTLECVVILEGVLNNATFAKVNGSTIGYVMRAEREVCEGGILTILRETLPWRVQYEVATGTLPDIEELRVRVVGVSGAASTGFFFSCLMRSIEAAPARVRFAREAGGFLTGAILDTLSRIPTTGYFCEEYARLLGVADPVVTGTRTQIRLSLI
jgi:hypothetical protein